MVTGKKQTESLRVSFKRNHNFILLMKQYFMQKLQMNLPQDQLELLAPTVFLVKEITGLLPLNPAHPVCFDPHPSWLRSMPSSYYSWKKQQQPVPPSMLCILLMILQTAIIWLFIKLREPGLFSQTPKQSMLTLVL